MNKTFAIGIPTINRYDLLHEALSRYVRDFPNTEIIVLDNGHQGIKDKFDFVNLTVCEPVGNLGVARSWNMLCAEILQHHQYAIILNDDVYWGKGQAEVLEYFEKNKDNPWFFLSTYGFCSFAMSRKVWQLVGPFDKNFYPAYFEDNDYLRRLHLARVNVHNDPFLSPSIHRNSSSIQKTPELNNGWKPNQDYYITKWGGKPGEEKFIIPFNS